PQNFSRWSSLRPLPQHTTPRAPPAPRETTALLVAEPQSPTSELTPERAVFLNQVRDDVLPLMIPPAGQRRQKNSDQGEVNHAASLHCRTERIGRLLGRLSGTLRAVRG